MDAGLGLPGRIILACEACDTVRKFLLVLLTVLGLGPGRLLVGTTCGICAHLYIPHVHGRGGWCIYGAAGISMASIYAVYPLASILGSTILASIIGEYIWVQCVEVSYISLQLDAVVGSRGHDQYYGADTSLGTVVSLCSLSTAPCRTHDALGRLRTISTAVFRAIVQDICNGRDVGDVAHAATHLAVALLPAAQACGEYICWRVYGQGSVGE